MIIKPTLKPKTILIKLFPIIFISKRFFPGGEVIKYVANPNTCKALTQYQPKSTAVALYTPSLLMPKIPVPVNTTITIKPPNNTYPKNTYNDKGSIVSVGTPLSPFIKSDHYLTIKEKYANGLKTYALLENNIVCYTTSNGFIFFKPLKKNNDNDTAVITQDTTNVVSEHETIYVNPQGESHHELPQENLNESSETTFTEKNNDSLIANNSANMNTPALDNVEKTSVTEEFTYFNQNNKLYTTTITKDSKVSDFTKTQLLEELRKRDLIKDDDKTESKMLDINDNIVVVGKAINGYKITPRGMAYYNQVHKKTTSSPPNIEEGELYQQDIITAPAVNAALSLVTTGIHNHVYVAWLVMDFYYSSGYLTGANKATILHKILFQHYQQQQEGNVTNFNENNHKKQCISEFANLMRIPKDKAVRLKYGHDYLQYIQKADFFTKRIQELKHKDIVEYDDTGITQEDALKICKDYDYNIINKLKHPQTDLELTQQELGKKKQKDLQETEKKNKTKSPISDAKQDNPNNVDE